MGQNAVDQSNGVILSQLIKLIFCMPTNTEGFNKLILSFWACTARHAQSAQNKKFAYLCNILRRTWGLKLIFCLQINTKVFYKLIVSLWMCNTRHAEITHNNKFTISLQYVKKEFSDEVHFLDADKHDSFLQIDTIIFDSDS